MNYINDEDVFKAVSFASSMIKKGKPITHAIKIASSYYKVDTSEVAKNLGKRGATVKNKRR